MSNTNVNNKALLSGVKISIWSATKTDKQISKEVDNVHGTNKAGTYHKKILDKSAISGIKKVGGKIRNYHYKMTLPWADTGERLLPVKLFSKYSTEIDTLKAEYESEVQKFVNNYSALIQQAQSELKSLFNPTDYPSVDEIKGKFFIRTSFVPLPNTNDFRLSLGNSDEIKVQVERELNQRHSDAIGEVFDRVKSHIEYMIDKLSDSDAKFKNALVNNLEELIELIPAMNYANDPKLNKLHGELKSLVCDPEMLRTDDKVRTEYAKRAEKLKNTFF